MVCATRFSMIARHLYKMGSYEIMCQYVTKFEQLSILAQAHVAVAGGHYAGKATAQKILRGGLWWPTVHKDSKAYCRVYDSCERMGKPSRRNGLPLNPQITLQVFDKWGIDFRGLIEPPGKKTNAPYIITTTKYLTQCAEVQPVKDCTATTATKFIFHFILP